jgi:hypothetical protein
MARAVAIKRATGDEVYPAMVKFSMDGNLTVPDAWDVGVTVVTEEDDGTDVNASEAVLAATSGVTDNRDAIEALVAAINANITGCFAWYGINQVDEYIVKVKATGGTAKLVQLSTPLFEASE